MCLRACVLTINVFHRGGGSQDPTWRCKAWDEIDVMPKAGRDLELDIVGDGKATRCEM